MVDKKRLKEEQDRKAGVEILKLAGCLDDTDEDVAELCIGLMPKGKDQCISMADVMEGVQKIVNKYKGHKLRKGKPCQHCNAEESKCETCLDHVEIKSYYREDKSKVLQPRRAKAIKNAKKEPRNLTKLKKKEPKEVAWVKNSPGPRRHY